MSVSERQEWITGEEYGEERVRLIEAGLGDSPEMEALVVRVVERDDYLWKLYAEPLIPKHPGEWAAVSLDGRVIIKPRSSLALAAGTEAFGGGNFAYGRLAEFRGYELHR